MGCNFYPLDLLYSASSLEETIIGSGSISTIGLTYTNPFVLVHEMDYMNLNN